AASGRTCVARYRVGGGGRAGARQGSDVEPEHAHLALAVLGHFLRAPRRRPDEVDRHRVHAVDLHHGELGVGLDEVLHGAAHARQGHLDADVAGVVDLHLVHEAEVHDVHGDLRVAYDLEGFEDLLAHGRL